MSLIQATIRETKTRGQVNSLRKKGEVPAIIYGGEDQNEKISLTKKEVKNLISKENFLSSVISISIDGKEHGIHRTWHKYDKQKKILFIYDRGELISRKCWSEQNVKYLLTNLNSDTLGIKF